MYKYKLNRIRNMNTKMLISEVIENSLNKEELDIIGSKLDVDPKDLTIETLCEVLVQAKRDAEAELGTQEATYFILFEHDFVKGKRFPYKQEWRPETLEKLKESLSTVQNYWFFDAKGDQLKSLFDRGLMKFPYKLPLLDKWGKPVLPEEYHQHKEKNRMLAESKTNASFSFR